MGLFVRNAAGCWLNNEMHCIMKGGRGSRQRSRDGIVEQVNKLDSCVHRDFTVFCR